MIKKILLIMCLLSLSVYLLADFTGLNTGARGYALGGAYTALADEPAGLLVNPAGLAKQGRYGMVASHQNMWGLDDLTNSMVAFSLPLPMVRSGLAYQHLELAGEYREQVVTLSGASIIWLNKLQPLRFGASLKFMQASAPGYDGADSPSAVDADFGVQFDPTPELTLGATAHNLLKARFEFLQESEAIKTNYAAGVCYNWRKQVNFLADWAWDDDDSRLRIGAEMWFFETFAPRLGMDGDRLTAGFGLKSDWWSLDGAVLAHNQLGSTYRLALGVYFDKLF